MSDEKIILCMKWGDMYGPEYVNNLNSMISRNISYSFKLFCMTENTSGISPDVECLPLPKLGFKVPPEAPGKWPKQALWSKELFGLKGVALFLDLDSVIVDSIDCYFECGNSEDVFTARNWVKPMIKSAQTSVFRFKIGSHPYLLETLQKDPQLCVKYQFEQNYLTHYLKGPHKYWPSQWTKHFRKHCMGPWPKRYLFEPKKPKKCKIVTFPGHPKPPDAILGRWSPQHQFVPPYQHLINCLRQENFAKSRKMLRRYIKPCKWVENNWHS